MLQHFGRVALCLYRVPNLFHFSIAADQRAASYDSFEGTAHEFLQAPDAIRFQHFVAGIADQRKIQFLLSAKARQNFFRIVAGADDGNSQLVEVLLCVTKLGRFCRSTGGVRFGKEKQDDTLALVGFQREFATFVRLQSKIRGFVADHKHESPQ